jgi:aspartyl-tRNA synthetase
MALLAAVGLSTLPGISGPLKEISRASENLHFFTLRDSSSSVQLVCRDGKLSEQLMSFPLESVILVEGSVKGRKQKVKAPNVTSVG